MLATKMFKIYRNVSPPIFSEIFHRHGVNHNLGINSESVMSHVRSSHGSESILYLDPKIWDVVPLELKPLNKDIKRWKPKNCPCRLCKKYVPNRPFSP